LIERQKPRLSMIFSTPILPKP